MKRKKKRSLQNNNSAATLGSLAYADNIKNGGKRKTQKDFNRLSIKDYPEIPENKILTNKLKELQGLVAKIESREQDKIQIPKFGKQYKIQYQKLLNKQQLQAVVTVDGPLPCDCRRRHR